MPHKQTQITQISKKTSVEGKHLTRGEIALKSNKRELLPKQSESQLQKSCVRWFRKQYRRYVLFAIPNGGKRNVITATNLKKEGVVSGVGDLFLMTSNSKYHGLFIEMKVGYNKQTTNQLDFMETCIRERYGYIVCTSLDEFMTAVNTYLRH